MKPALDSTDSPVSKALIAQHPPLEMPDICVIIRRGNQRVKRFRRFPRPVAGTVDEFVERDLGVATGHAYAEIDAAYPDGNIPGLEPLDSVCDRAMRGFRRAAIEYSDRRLVIVAHAYVINAILYTVTNGKAGSTGIPRIRNGYVATLTRVGDQWAISDHPAD